ncbi:MAG: ABC transporter permease [Phycisphaerae bacterium]|nr:ABC transporter permease [Phycisphaerae bacterium]
MPPADTPRSIFGPVELLGERALAVVAHLGYITLLVLEMGRWVAKSVTNRKVRLGRAAIVAQVVRVGVRSIFIISLVSACVGLILVLQMAPPLDEFGRKDLVANIVGVAVLRELGPLIAAIVLTGFAGAAIAAEIGTMVVGEEIEALEAHALNPVRFLVIPRVVASVVSMTAIAVIADAVSIAAGLGVATLALDISRQTYVSNLLDQVKLVDFLTGVGKATVFGMLIGLIACGNGLKVSGGAAGVGKATTDTVVQSVVAIIIADLIFTAIFYAWRLV